MLSSLLNAVRPFRARPFRRFFLLFSFSLAFSARCTPADNTLDDAVLQLAERVSAIPNLRGPLRLQFFQDLSFQSETGKGWQEIFRKEIENHHLSVTDDPSANILRVGVAETPTQLVLSASARVLERDDVRFFVLPRSSFRAASLPVAPIRIERQLVHQSPDRILDASPLGNGAEGGLALLVSGNSELSVLRFDSSGQTNQAISLAAASQPSRDPRGEIAIHANDVSVLLSDQVCNFSWSASSDVKCHAAKTLWRKPAVLTPACDANGWKLLADGPDWSTPDSLQVVPDGALRQGSASLRSDFPGPVLSINAEQNLASALVVTKNLRTGDYEVYKITLICGN
jgi:hypothetical protein